MKSSSQVAHMMRRVRLNMYRAEDEMFIIRKRQVCVRIGKENISFCEEEKTFSCFSGGKKMQSLRRSKHVELKRLGREGGRRTC